MKATHATLHWSIEDPRELEAQVPGLAFLAEVPAYDAGRLARFSGPARVAIRAMLAVPVLRRLGRFLRYRF